MARRGPKPKPTAPEDPQSEPVDARELEFLPELTERARAVWLRDLDSFIKVLITRADETAFGGYCQTRAQIEEVEEYIATLKPGAERFFIRNAYGQVSKHPVWNLLVQLKKLELDYLKALGMTPSSRGKAKVQGDKPPEIPDEIQKRRERLKRRMEVL